jgi:hypothetical protein
MSLKDIWLEFEHILGIATALAPIVAVSDPQAAAGIGSAEAAIAIAKPLIDSVTASAAGQTLTQDQLNGLATQAITSASNIAVATGKLTQTTATQIQMLAPALVAASAAANKPLAPTA